MDRYHPYRPYDFAAVTETFVTGACNIIGLPYDRTASFRKGAFHGSRAIRKVFSGIEYYSPYLDKDLSRYQIYDLGDLSTYACLESEEEWKRLMKEFFQGVEGIDLKKTPILTLGGEHSISYAPIKSYLETFDDLVLVHLDAHADLRDGYQGFHYSHASIVRRVWEYFGSKHDLIQYGIRSGTREEYLWMREHNTLKTSLDSFLQSVEEIDARRPIYLTLDLDYFDPAYLPGTGTPEPGGETFHSFIKLIKVLDKKNFVGADVVELAPDIDSTGNSAVFAAKVVRELILAMVSQEIAK